MLSYNQVAEAIEIEGRRIGQLAEEIAECANNAAEAEADHKIEVAKARVKYVNDRGAEGIKPTVSATEDYATLICAESLRNYLVAREALTAIREALRAAQARLDGLRTLAAGYRQAGG